MSACPWPLSKRLQPYHDTEWGMPVPDAGHLYEHMVLATFYAGIGWEMVMTKRAGFQAAFGGFVPERVATMTPGDVALLLQDTRVIRNRAKLEAAVHNTQCWLALQAEVGGPEALVRWCYDFVGGAPVVNRWAHSSEVPKESAAAQALSKAWQKRGFRLLGPIGCYFWMQATGLVNDHLLHCPRHAACQDTWAELGWQA